MASIARPISVKNILLAIDFSEATLATFPYVESVAAHYGSNIHAMHVAGSGVFPLLPLPKQDRVIGEAKEKMQTFLSSSESASRFKQIVRGGEPSDILYQYGKELRIDLLVLGTNGHRGLRRCVLGSVAEEIFRSVPCPALTVGPKARGGNTQAPVRRILFATDFAPPSLEALPCAIRLAQELRAILTLLHVTRTKQEREKAKAQMEKLVAKESRPDVKLDWIVQTGSPAATILKTAKMNKLDLIVMGVRSGGTWSRAATHAPGPVAYNVIAQSPCPVLTLRSHHVQPETR